MGHNTIMPMAVGRAQRLFLVRFFSLLVLFYLIVALPLGDRYLVAPFTHILAKIGATILREVGEPVAVNGTLMYGNRFGVDIKNGCNGIEVVIFLCAAMVAFEAPLGWRLIGIAAGALAIQILNMARIVSLYLLGLYRRDLFDRFHLTIWQSIIFAAAVFIFFYWTTRVRRIDAASAR